MIELKNVTKKFKDAVIVDNVSADFPDGTIIGIIGRNGSGKTVLFKMICGLMLPTSGEITVNGKRIGKDVDFPPSLGAIIETPDFIHWQTGLQSLMDLAMLRKKISEDGVRDAIRRVGLDPDDRKRVGRYSLGMRQRLAIAQAIMEDPDVLILDEPFNSLDSDGVEEMRKLFFQLKEQGKTLLIASHNSDDINILCDRVYGIEKGILSEHTKMEGQQ